MTITITGQTITDVRHQLGFVPKQDWITINPWFDRASDKLLGFRVHVRADECSFEHTSIDEVLCRVKALLEIVTEKS